MVTAALDRIDVINPATGALLAQVATTPAEEVIECVARARRVQPAWRSTSWSDRKAVLRTIWRRLAAEGDDWAVAIRDEIGKPASEALAGDVIPTLDAARWTVRHGGGALASERLGAGHQRLLQIPTARLTHEPVGVIGMIGTWNYPLFLNATPILQALAAGNAVVWKPSELASWTGQRLQRCLEESGVPTGLVQAVYGGADVGRALVAAGIDKGFFTGGVENGRRVLAALGERGVPAVAELSGFDPALVLPDAPREAMIPTLAWASFLGAGQTCVAIKRVYVVGDPRPWAEDLGSVARSLRVGNPAESPVDMGPLISESARNRFDHQIQSARAQGAQLIEGGAAVPGPGWFYRPTVLLAEGPEAEKTLAGAFGPVVIVRGVPNPAAAIEAANSSVYALGASVWAKDRRLARDVAAQLQAGMVTINEAVTPTMHASAPFGGTRASGFGRTHGVWGLREFTYPRVTYERRPGGFRPQVFPYGVQPVEQALRLYRWLFHRP
ncbi:MAG: aldehyde dehydrogenase family protein [Isosphaeraceae bacterium]